MRRWPEIRAGLIAIAIGFGLIDGCPLPPPADTPAWERGFVEPVRAAQRIALSPMAWVRSVVRVSQRWALYQAPGGQRFRMVIEGEDAGGAWHVLFRAGDPDHDEDADVINCARVNGSWHASDHPADQYAAFTGWITARVLERHPELIAARVRIEKIQIVPGGFTSSGEFVWGHTYVRQGRGGPGGGS